MASEAYALHEHRVVVFWSRKAGCTSLAAWLDAVLGGTPDASRPRARLASRRPGLRVDVGDAIELVRSQGYEDFVLARNPIRRAISAYVEKFVYDRGRPLDRVERLKPFAWDVYVEAAGLTAEQARSTAYRGLSFASFVEHVAKVARERPGDPAALNGHWRPQVPADLAGHRFRHVVKLEQPADFAPLARRLETEIAFPHLRANHIPARVEDAVALSQVPSIELIRAGVVPGPRALLDAHTLGLLREAYATDFRVLGYDPAAGAEYP